MSESNNAAGKVASWVWREVLNPFELLYLAIAVATFTHTVWAAAFLFEGAVADGDPWWNFKGALIAIAVDMGMLLTSKFLQEAKHPIHVGALILSFVVAAVTSFYFQMVYIMYHTPTFVTSAGVNTYWVGVMTPFIDARVFLLPAFLPVLATVYTVARIFTHRAANSELEHRQLSTVKLPAPKSGDDKPTLGLQFDLLDALVTKLREMPLELPDGFDGVVSAGPITVNLRSLTWANGDNGKSYGPYKSRGMLVAGMKQAIKMSPRLLPPGDEDPDVINVE